MITVRPGREPDFWAVADIWVRSWQTAYAGIVPQPVLDSLDPLARHRSLLDRAADPANDAELLVAAEDAVVAGFAVIGPWRGQDRRDDGRVAGDGAGEIRAIYVASDRWRQGTGRALMAAAVARLDALGHVEQHLWVLAANARGRGFYESVGWRFDGARQDYHTGGVALPEVRYSRNRDPNG